MYLKNALFIIIYIYDAFFLRSLIYIIYIHVLLSNVQLSFELLTKTIENSELVWPALL